MFVINTIIAIINYVLLFVVMCDQFYYSTTINTTVVAHSYQQLYTTKVWALRQVNVQKNAIIQYRCRFLSPQYVHVYQCSFQAWSGTQSFKSNPSLLKEVISKIMPKQTKLNTNIHHLCSTSIFLLNQIKQNGRL